MSDAEQDGRLRLVQLVPTLASIPEPARDLGQILDLAAKNEIRLYARVPLNKVVYVDEMLPIVIHRRSSMHFNGASGFARYSPLSHQLHPEITHVSLDPDQAGELKTRCLTRDIAFASGLSAHPDSTLAQAGWWKPCQFGTSLVICPDLSESEHKKKRQLVRCIWFEVTPYDIYVDERVVALLEEQQASIHDDPYYLRKRAPGVYALYRAAERYWTALKTEQVTFVEVKDHIDSQLPKLGKTHAGHVAKLINPLHRRNSGVPKEKQKSFDPNILSKPDFRTRYMRAPFVTEALALTLYVTDQWLDSHARFTTHASNKQLSSWDIDKIFEQLGFYQKEREALTRLVLLHRPASYS